jgi:cell pole-organizing protein PopZ
MSEAKGQSEPSMEEILASIRRIIAEDGDAAPATNGAAAPLAEAEAEAEPDPVPLPEPEEDEVLELTEMVAEDGSVTSLAKSAIEAPAPTPVTAADPSPRTAGADRLVSPEAANATTAALSQLMARGPREETLISVGGRTVEDLVRELLRPLLKSWLDDNLPPMVERLVQEEIARLVRDVHGR